MHCDCIKLGTVVLTTTNISIGSSTTLSLCMNTDTYLSQNHILLRPISPPALGTPKAASRYASAAKSTSLGPHQSRWHARSVMFAPPPPRSDISPRHPWNTSLTTNGNQDSLSANNRAEEKHNAFLCDHGSPIAYYRTAYRRSTGLKNLNGSLNSIWNGQRSSCPSLWEPNSYWDAIVAMGVQQNRCCGGETEEGDFSAGS